MLNKIIIMGRLTRDPELRRTGSGTAVTSFSLAVDRDFKSQNGEKETDFIDVVAWRSTAEFVSKYFTKGRMAVVEGRLQIRDWTDKDGGKRRSAEIVADNAQVMIRLAYPQILEEHLVELVVVVLTGVDQNLLKVPVAALYRGGQPDDFRPRTDNRHQLQLSHCYTSSK